MCFCDQHSLIKGDVNMNDRAHFQFSLCLSWTVTVRKESPSTIRTLPHLTNCCTCAWQHGRVTNFGQMQPPEPHPRIGKLWIMFFHYFEPRVSRLSFKADATAAGPTDMHTVNWGGGGSLRSVMSCCCVVLE